MSDKRDKNSPGPDPIVVGMVQITEPMLEYVNMPYAAALLQAYVQAHAADPGRYLFQLPLFQRLPLEQAARTLSLARVVGFSTYVWNEQYSLALVRRLKQLNPEVLTIFGGPQVPDRCTAFMQANPEIDLCVHGEGEEVLLQILERFPQRNWEGIPSLSHRGAGNEIITAAKAPRMHNLDRVPSPYLTGVLDPLLHTNKGKKWVGIWETNRGCPFSCTFCDWGSAVASKVYSFSMERLLAEMQWFASNQIDAIYCIDSNYGMLTRDLAITEEIIKVKQAYGFPRILYTQTAKNVTERAYTVQKMMMDAGMNGVATLSLQTVSPEALQAIKRENISLDTYHELQRRFRADGVPTYTDYLVGLPGETFESFITGVGTVIAQGQHREMRNWNTYILPNAEMSDPDYRQIHGIESVRSMLRSWHQPVDDANDGVQEYQEMLVACKTFSREDWVRMRVFAWLTQVLYFGRALQLPLMLLHELTGLPYHRMLLPFLEDPLPPGCEVLEQLRLFLFGRAREMVAGGPEYTAGKDPSTGKPVWMAPDYFASVHLLMSPKLDVFFQECGQVLTRLDPGSALPKGVLTEALSLSRGLFCSQRSEGASFGLRLNWNLWECYEQVLAGARPELRAQPSQFSYRVQQGKELAEVKPLMAFSPPNRI